MYAIIRTGGKQAKVREGDVLDVERLRAEGEVSFTPLLVVDDAGTVFSGRDDLKAAKVVARVVGDAAGPKVDVFKYKNKTGYRRHMGHRQKYTTIEVTSIQPPAEAKSEAAGKAATKDEAEAPAEKRAPKKAAPKTAAKKPASGAPEAEKPAAKKPAAKKPAAKKPADGETATKTTTKKTPASKSTTAKNTTKKSPDTSGDAKEA